MLSGMPLLRSRLALAIACVLVMSTAGAYQGDSRGDANAYAERITDSSEAQVLVDDLPLSGGGFQRVLYAAPTHAMRGVIVMFPGGTDELRIEKNGAIRHGENFLVRTRALWLARGYGVVLVDAIDRQSMRSERSTSAYGEVTQEILAFARERAQVPVWVMGTSQGSIAAVNAAAHAGRGDIAGLILTESVSVLGGSHETVFDAHPEEVRVPTLVVANDNDQCRVAPPAMADAIARSLNQISASVLRVHGGEQQSSNACGSLSPHGYLGIEDSVIDAVVDWMEKTQA